MNDRGMIKWQPFNSVISNKTILNSLIKEQERIEKPEMSEEEIITLEKQLIDAFYMQEKLDITYYKNGYLIHIISYIKKIDQVYKIVYLENINLLFNQIISIKEVL